MKKLDPIQYLTGFLMGTFLGCIAEAAILIPAGLLFRWFGGILPEPAWWMPLLLIPLPLSLGLVAGRVVARLHLEDY